MKNPLRRWYREFMLAMQFATTLPAVQIHDVTEQEVVDSVIWFPVLGAILGGTLMLSFRVLHAGLAPWPTALLVVVLYTLLTGALHIDGLMDTADAVGSRAKRERALEIMRDSRVGAMGAIAGCLLLIGKVVAIASLPLNHSEALIAVLTISRAAMVWSMTIAPSARGNEGLAGMYAQKIPRTTSFIAGAFALVVSVATFGWILGIAVVGFAGIATFLFVGWMRKRFGGMTGDTYGALHELIELGGLLFLTATF